MSTFSNIIQVIKPQIVAANILFKHSPVVIFSPPKLNLANIAAPPMHKTSHPPSLKDSNNLCAPFGLSSILLITRKFRKKIAPIFHDFWLQSLFHFF